MDLIALILAALALVLALAAYAHAGGAARQAREAARDAQRRTESSGMKLEADINNLRRMVAAQAASEPLTKEMVMQGQLWREVDPKAAQRMVEAGEVRLLDVRTVQETSLGIIPGALLIPIDQIEARHRELPKDGRTTLIYCAGGGRSAAACQFLSEQGFSNLLNLTGGFSSWSGPRAKP